MRTRRVVTAAIGIGCVCIVALCLFVAQLINARIKKEQYFKIQHGMPRAQVQLLGREPGDYTSGRGSLAFGELRRQTVPGTPQDWITDEVKVTVWFNDEGKVTESILLYNWDSQLSRWERLLRSWLRKLGF